MYFFRLSRQLAFTTCALSFSLSSLADHAHFSSHQIETIVVTGHNEKSIAVLQSDLKAPRQPLPAHDGADYLKTIPGFSVTRKGGADGDISFRGMAGSRLGLVVDGEVLLGACNSRMDAPTSYIYPETLDKLSLIKGPQSVQYGPGYSSGVIRLDSERPDFSQLAITGYSSATVASFNRYDAVLQTQAGGDYGFVKLSGSYSRASDYKDGDKRKVHSEYERYNGSLSFALTPSEDTFIQVSQDYSDGEAAYADRGMDGTQFLRQGTRIFIEQENLSEHWSKVSVNFFTNEVDHIMDDQKLRKPGMMGYSRLIRETQGFRLASEFNWQRLSWVVGIDGQDNKHKSKQAGPNKRYGAWQKDAKFSQYGIFTELDLELSQTLNWVSGIRHDNWQAKDQRQEVKKNMMMSVANPSFNQKRKQSLSSGFTRLEISHGHSMYFIGFGVVERFPDYWEIIAKESVSSASAFKLKHETNKQWDAAWLYQRDGWFLNASIFYSRIDNFILIDYGQPMKTMGVAKNIRAESFGGEFSGRYSWQSGWQLETSLAHTHGRDRSNKRALPQVSPTEARIALNYHADKWHIGSLLRGVNKQNRYQKDKGNIVGKDLGKSAGFATLSLNAGWQPLDALLVTFGIDNLFNKTYAEFISRSGGNGMGGSISGYEQTLRVNEPGRIFWAKAQYKF